MKVYLSLFKLRFINNLQYRIAAIAGLTTQIFFGFIFIGVYLAFYTSNPNAELPMNWQSLVNYLWLNQAFFALVYMYVKNEDFLSMIRNGNIAYELVRPINFYKKWFATMYGNRLASVSLRFIPVIVIAFLLPSPYKMGLPASPAAFSTFIIALILSSLISTAFCLFYHVVTIYTIDPKGFAALAMVLCEILAGGTIPLSFFPTF